MDLAGQDAVFPLGINSTKGIVGYGDTSSALPRVTSMAAATPKSSPEAAASDWRGSMLWAAISDRTKMEEGSSIACRSNYTYFVPTPCAGLGGISMSLANRH